MRMFRTRSKRRVFMTVMVVLIAMGAAAPAVAQTSVGVMLGEPSGLSAKQWIGDNSAVDLAVAWSFLAGGSFYVHVDYQQHFDDFDIDEGDLHWFVGGGAKMAVSSSALSLGVRVPLGLFYVFEDVPIELFLEVAPGIDLFPAFLINGGGGIGVRYRL